MRTCKFDSSKHCGEEPSKCLNCPTRKQSGQQTFNVIDKQKQADAAFALVEKKVEQKPLENAPDNMDIAVMCPYCLLVDKLHVFLISTKQGYHKKNAKCPHCNNGFEREVLTKDMTATDYAEWVIMETKYGFWQKINFTFWKTRLAEIGWAGEFWDYYRKNKPKGNIDEYEERINEQAREEWEKQPETMAEGEGED